jgi:hypothetical protein
MKRMVLTGSLCLLALAGFPLSGLDAQQGSQAAADTRLPIQRVVLYKSGVGYFEHLGRVTDTSTVTIEFTSGQLDDVLKSLTVLDLDGGRVSGVGYNSDAGLQKQLSTLRLPLGESASRTQLLTALRGARVEVRDAATRQAGRILSVEQRQLREAGATSSVDVLHLVTDAGDIHMVELTPGVAVRMLDTDVSEEVARYLAIVGSARDRDVRRLTMTSTGTGERDLFVSYVSEVPVWKSTYRLVLGRADDAAPLLQGWAIVDNTIGEDWTNVQLSLVAGAPQAFIQQISRPYYVQRPVVPLPERVLTSPQTHEGTLSASGAASISGTVTDQSGGTIPGATITVLQGGRPVSTAVTDGSGQFRIGVSPGTYDVTFSLSGFQTVRQQVRVVTGSTAIASAALPIGSMSEEVRVSAAAPMVATAPPPPPPPASPAPRFAGRGGGAFIDRVQAAQDAMQTDATGADLGDLFEYTLATPVTIPKNQSAMVPIVNGAVTADVVSLWSAAEPSTRPRRALWLTNTTGQTLDAGSVSIVEGQAFVGEGLMESITPGERRLISYASDLAMRVADTIVTPPSRVTRVSMARGIVTQQREDRQERTYTIRNDDQAERVLILEHPARTDWTLDSGLAPEERTASVYRFRIVVAPSSTSTLTVSETRPVDTTVRAASVGDQQIAMWVSARAVSDQLVAQLRDIRARQSAIAALSAQVSSLNAEVDTITRDQERVRENLKSLRGSAEERQLTQRYVRQLDEQETRLESLRTEIARVTTQRNAAQAALEQFIESISG